MNCVEAASETLRNISEIIQRYDYEPILLNYRLIVDRSNLVNIESPRLPTCLNHAGAVPVIASLLVYLRENSEIPNPLDLLRYLSETFATQARDLAFESSDDFLQSSPCKHRLITMTVYQIAALSALSGVLTIGPTVLCRPLHALNNFAFGFMARFLGTIYLQHTLLNYNRRVLPTEYLVIGALSGSISSSLSRKSFLYNVICGAIKCFLLELIIRYVFLVAESIAESMYV